MELLSASLIFISAFVLSRQPIIFLFNNQAHSFVSESASECDLSAFSLRLMNRLGRY